MRIVYSFVNRTIGILCWRINFDEWKFEYVFFIILKFVFFNLFKW